MMDWNELIFTAADHPAATASVFLAAYVLLHLAVKRLFRPRFPRKFKARVVHVCDGDSIWVKQRFGRRVKLRLIGIDAPETEQAFGRDATECLKRKIAGEAVDVTAVGVDPYGRLVSRVMLGKTDVSEFMIREGLAWPYWRYFARLSQDDAVRYNTACESAKKKKKGLWQETNPLAPWTWRENHRSWLARLLYAMRRLFRRLFGLR